MLRGVSVALPAEHGGLSEGAGRLRGEYEAGSTVFLPPDILGRQSG